MSSSIQIFKSFLELEKLQPPRPGLVPQSGDWNAPDRWIRPEEAEEPDKQVLPEETYVDFIKDTRKDLVGKYITSASWKDKRLQPSPILEKAGFKYIGYRDLRSDEERQKDFYPSDSERVQIWQHSQLGKLEVYSKAEKKATFEGEDTWEKIQTIVNPNPDFKPDLRNPETLSLQERIISRQNYSKYFMSSEATYRWEERAKGYGISVEELKARTLAKIAPLVKKANIWIRVPPQKLNGILSAGRFISLSESKKMGPGKTVGIAKYLPIREEEEERLFGIPVGKMQEKRPIYGYLSDDTDGNGSAFNKGGEQEVDAYGTVAIKLKSSARQKTTFTIGDSLDMNIGGIGNRTVPAFVDDPKAEVVLGDTEELEKPINSILELTRGGYTEAQIHGVDISDIDEIIFHEDVSDSILRHLEKMQISYRKIHRKEIGRPEKRGKR